MTPLDLRVAPSATPGVPGLLIPGTLPATVSDPEAGSPPTSRDGISSRSPWEPGGGGARVRRELGGVPPARGFGARPPLRRQQDDASGWARMGRRESRRSGRPGGGHRHRVRPREDGEDSPPARPGGGVGERMFPWSGWAVRSLVPSTDKPMRRSDMALNVRRWRLHRIGPLRTGWAAVHDGRAFPMRPVDSMPLGIHRQNGDAIHRTRRWLGERSPGLGPRWVGEGVAGLRRKPRELEAPDRATARNQDREKEPIPPPARGRIQAKRIGFRQRE